MATSPDGFPYGSRWNYRTPSPDFARTAVEPLSPPATSTSTFAVRTPSFTNNYAPSNVYSYFPQYPAMPSRSIRDIDAAAPQQPFNHGYLLSRAAVEKQPQIRETNPLANPLDALADIALAHGANHRLASTPVYNPPALPLPCGSPPTVATTMVSSWQQPDSTHPSILPKPLEVASTISVEPITSHTSTGRDQNYGPIGHERRSFSGVFLGSREYSSVEVSATVPRRSSVPVSSVLLPAAEPIPMPKLPQLSEPSLPTMLDSMSSSKAKTDESYYPWINSSPIDEYMNSPDDSAIHEHSITVQRPEDPISPTQYQPKDGFLDVDAGKPRNTSLPTPTQDDHIIASSVGLSRAAVDQSQIPHTNEPVVNLTPECAEADNFTNASGVIKEPSADVGKLPVVVEEQIVVAEKPITAAKEPNVAAEEPTAAVEEPPMAIEEVPVTVKQPSQTTQNGKPVTVAVDRPMINATLHGNINTPSQAHNTEPRRTERTIVEVVIEVQQGGSTSLNNTNNAPLPLNIDHFAGIKTGLESQQKPDYNASRSRRSSSRHSKPPEVKKISHEAKARTVSTEPKGTAVPTISPSQPSGEEEDCQTCKVHYSEDDGRNGAWIGCDGCKGWHHARCVGLDQATVDKIDKFYCIACEPTHGKSTLKRSSGRARTVIDYDALHNGSSAPVRNPDDPRIHPYINKILDKSHPFAEDDLRRVRPELVTCSVIDSKDGAAWTEPFIVPAKWNPTPWHGGVKNNAPAIQDSSPGISVPPPPELPPNGTRRRSGSPIKSRPSPTTQKADGDIESAPREDADALDMRIPPGLTVRRVAEMVGVDMTVPMMDVVTQEPPKETWTMGRLADYFESPVKETIYNCISCEVSNSPLGDMISRPKAVRDSDLVDRVWKHAPTYSKPTVGKYVLMSVKDSFTDFHVDFGGSSVFYHIYEGQKVFLVIPPTEKALKTYEKWSSSEHMNHTFLPDELPDIPCKMIALEKGDTFFIPSGWIHAVYTPVDSLVVGGNFLTRNFYVNQMRVHNIEAVTGVPKQMRYPRFTTLMWASMFNYIESDRMPREIEKDLLTDILGRKNKFKPSKHSYTTEELKGLPSLIDFLYRNVMIIMGVITTSQRPGAPRLVKGVVDNVRKAIPWPVSRDPLLYLKHFARWCVWKRACADIVPGGEKIPEWAQVDWLPPGLPVVDGTDGSAEAPLQADGESPGNDTPRRGGLRDRSKLSISPEDSLESFDLFPERTLPAITGLNGSRRSSSQMPGQSKRKPDARSDTPGPSSKKTKATRRNRQFTPMPPPSDGRKNTDQYLQLADGSIYVKKLSNLGPPRIGCESCRLKKTGCKHKEEIRARGWCDDDRLILDMDGKPEQGQDDDGDETVDDTPSKPGPAGAPVEARKDKSPPKSAFASSSSPPQKSSTAVTHKQISTLNPKPANNRAADGNGPPIGYKGRKPSCEDCKILKKKCLHQDTWKLVQDKQAAAEAKKALKKHEQTHRRQAKESKRKATVQRQKAGVKPSEVKEFTPVVEVEESIVLRAPAPNSAPASAPPSTNPTVPLSAAAALFAPLPTTFPTPLPPTLPEEPPAASITISTAAPTAALTAVPTSVPSAAPPAVPTAGAPSAALTAGAPTAAPAVAPPVLLPAPAKVPPARAQPKAPSKVPSKAASKALSPPKETVKRSTPKLKGKAPADDFDLGLDTSILEEAPQYTSTATVVPPAADPSIMAPPMDVFDESPKASKAVQQPRIMPPPSPMTAATAELQKEYIAALHQRTATSRPKVTYTSSNKSIKRKAEEESPEQAQARKMKTEPVDGQTTFENLRQLSLGLRVRGQRGGEVC